MGKGFTARLGFINCVGAEHLAKKREESWTHSLGGTRRQLLGERQRCLPHTRAP